MDRRKSIKALIIGTAATGVMIDACKPEDKKAAADTKPASSEAEADRMKEEIAFNKKLNAELFFTKEEMATITVLADIIIPKDAVSGSASDAKVPDFIEFIVKDMPHYQTPMRGGLRWLDMESLKRFEKSFVSVTPEQRIQIVDDIAYPNKVKPGMKQGVSFFNLMRNLTSTGFYTSEIGVKDVGYKGNVPNLWNGVPDDILKQYGLAYSEKELKECISYE
ncbi:MAG TPA: gluconate 2-dehydrogenase subunit 3 family protein [Ferruginibacter sp.]|nr:gluconate 2-dehydrogenase subunit 3 family protein [Ferruginibacter sp.]HPH92084.1 gluconate 2-dehydrogenase subunit 3 family protein [Ferruginibacter sp.]